MKISECEQFLTEASKIPVKPIPGHSEKETKLYFNYISKLVKDVENAVEKVNKGIKKEWSKLKNNFQKPPFFFDENSEEKVLTAEDLSTITMWTAFVELPVCRESEIQSDEEYAALDVLQAELVKKPYISDINILGPDEDKILIEVDFVH